MSPPPPMWTSLRGTMRPPSLRAHSPRHPGRRRLRRASRSRGKSPRLGRVSWAAWSARADRHRASSQKQEAVWRQARDVAPHPRVGRGHLRAPLGGEQPGRVGRHDDSSRKRAQRARSLQGAQRGGSPAGRSFAVAYRAAAAGPAPGARACARAAGTCARARARTRAPARARSIADAPARTGARARSSAHACARNRACARPRTRPRAGPDGAFPRARRAHACARTRAAAKRRWALGSLRTVIVASGSIEPSPALAADGS